jgi:hypothetical protein
VGGQPDSDGVRQCEPADHAASGVFPPGGRRALDLDGTVTAFDHRLCKPARTVWRRRDTHRGSRPRPIRRRNDLTISSTESAPTAPTSPRSRARSPRSRPTKPRSLPCCWGQSTPTPPARARRQPGNSRPAAGRRRCLAVAVVAGRRGPRLNRRLATAVIAVANGAHPAATRDQRSGAALARRWPLIGVSAVQGPSSMVGDTGFEPVTSSVSRKRATTAPIARGVLLEVETGFEPVYAALQAAASPLGHSTMGVVLHPPSG